MVQEFGDIEGILEMEGLKEAVEAEIPVKHLMMEDTGFSSTITLDLEILETPRFCSACKTPQTAMVEVDANGGEYGGRICLECLRKMVRIERTESS